MGAPSPFETWLTATGLVRPVDFKFAFCSAEEAAGACPDAAAEAAEAWLAVTTSKTRLPSTWALDTVQTREHQPTSFQDFSPSGHNVLDRVALQAS